MKKIRSFMFEVKFQHLLDTDVNLVIDIVNHTNS